MALFTCGGSSRCVTRVTPTAWPKDPVFRWAQPESTGSLGPISAHTNIILLLRSHRSNICHCLSKLMKIKKVMCNKCIIWHCFGVVTVHDKTAGRGRTGNHWLCGRLMWSSSPRWKPVSYVSAYMHPSNVAHWNIVRWLAKVKDGLLYIYK